MFCFFTDKVLIKTVLEKVLMNADGQSSEVSVSANVFIQGLNEWVVF